MHHYQKVLILAFTMLFLASCSLPALYKPVSVTNTPVETEIIQEPQPTPSATDPTSTPILTPTKPPAFTSLNHAGPFILFKGRDEIWIINPDGSFPTKISNGTSFSDLHHAISPKGDQIALVVYANNGLDLRMISLPTGMAETIAHLITFTPTHDDYNTLIDSSDSYAWQPGEGRYLAFTAEMKGPRTNLYLYDTQTQKISQLTNGLTKIISPSWSPDGKYIVYEDASGKTEETIKVNSVWARQLSDGKLIRLSGPVGVVGWRDESHYIIFDVVGEYCDDSNRNLRSVDIVSGESTPLMDADVYFYYYLVQSPENGALLLNGTGRCFGSIGQGTFLLLPGETTPQKVSNSGFFAGDFIWMEESKVFHILWKTLISSDGKTRYDAPEKLDALAAAISKDGYQAWGIFGDTFKTDYVMVKAPGGEWQNILNGDSVLTGGPMRLIWSPSESKTLLILMQGSLYRASAPDFQAQQMGIISSDIDDVAWLP